MLAAPVPKLGVVAGGFVNGMGLVRALAAMGLHVVVIKRYLMKIHGGVALVRSTPRDALWFTAAWTGL
ncbi:MAG: hypothetical protein V1793_16680 [Pseudomonadota bacterium]